MKSGTTDLLIYGSLFCVGCVAFFSPFFFMNVSPVYQPYINYCTDTPEGKAVISRMTDRYDRDRKWDDEVAVQTTIQDIDGVRIWASENTTGDEQKAWLCWSDYFVKEYNDRYKLLHARNTVKYPPNVKP